MEAELSQDEEKDPSMSDFHRYEKKYTQISMLPKSKETHQGLGNSSFDKKNIENGHTVI